MFTKILYVGAGKDINPIKYFPDTKQFVFIDSQPRNEYGFEYYYKPFYRHFFVNELKEKLSELNFKLFDEIRLTNNYEEINRDYLDATKLYFSDKKGFNLRNERTLTYYISTAIPRSYFDLEKYIKEDIKDCDTVLVAGHNPHSIFLRDIKKPFYFVGCENTYFPKNYNSCEEDYLNTVLSYVLKYPLSVKKYVFMYENGDKKFFNTYEEFYNYQLTLQTGSLSYNP